MSRYARLRLNSAGIVVDPRVSRYALLEQFDATKRPELSTFSASVVTGAGFVWRHVRFTRSDWTGTASLSCVTSVMVDRCVQLSASQRRFHLLNEKENVWS